MMMKYWFDLLRLLSKKANNDMCVLCVYEQLLPPLVLTDSKIDRFNSAFEHYQRFEKQMKKTQKRSNNGFLV